MIQSEYICNIFCNKEKIMKKITSLLLVISMLLAVVPLSVFSVAAESSTDSQGVTYTLSDDGTYYIVSYFDDSVAEVVIPSEYNGLPVKEIGDKASMVAIS